MRGDFLETAVEELFAGIGVLGEKSRERVGRNQDGAFSGIFRSCPIEIDAIDGVELIGDGAADDVGHAGIRAETNDGGDAGFLPLVVSSFLFDGVNAHAAVVGVGTAGFKAGFEDVHLEAGEGGDAIDAEVAVFQQSEKGGAVSDIELTRLEAGIGERFLERSETVGVSVSGDNFSDARGEAGEKVANCAGAHESSATDDEDAH